MSSEITSSRTHSHNDLPGWVNWLAQDADGTWWGYEAEPLQRDHGWYENEVGRHVRLDREAPNPRWMDTLTRVTTEPDAL